MPNLKLDFKSGKSFKFDLKMKLIFIGSLCAFFIAIWFVVISGYQSGKSSSIIAQGKLLETAYQSKYQFLVNLKENAKKTDELQKKVNEAYVKILPVTNKISPIDSVTQIGNDEKLKFAYFKPKPVEKYTDYQVTPMEISLYGSFSNFLQFIDKLNKLDSTIILDDYTIMRGGEDPNGIIMNGTLKIYNGISEEDKKAAAAAAAAAAPKPQAPPKVKRNGK